MEISPRVFEHIDYYYCTICNNYECFYEEYKSNISWDTEWNVCMLCKEEFIVKCRKLLCGHGFCHACDLPREKKLPAIPRHITTYYYYYKNIERRRYREYQYEKLFCEKSIFNCLTKTPIFVLNIVYNNHLIHHQSIRDKKKNNWLDDLIKMKKAKNLHYEWRYKMWKNYDLYNFLSI